MNDFYEEYIMAGNEATWNDYWREYEVARKSIFSRELNIHVKVCEKLRIPLERNDLQTILRDLKVKPKDPQYKIRLITALKAKLQREKIRVQRSSQESPRGETAAQNWEKVSGFMNVKKALQDIVAAHPEDNELHHYALRYEVVFNFLEKVRVLPQTDPIEKASAIAELFQSPEGIIVAKAIVGLETSVLKPYQPKLELLAELVKPFQWLPRYPLVLKELVKSDLNALPVKEKFEAIVRQMNAPDVISEKMSILKSLKYDEVNRLGEEISLALKKEEQPDNIKRLLQYQAIVSERRENLRDALFSVFTEIPRLRISLSQTSTEEKTIAVVVCTVNKRGKMEFEKVTDPEKIDELMDSGKRLIEITPNSVRYVPRETGGAKLKSSMIDELGKRIAEEVKSLKNFKPKDVSQLQVEGTFESLKKAAKQALAATPVISRESPQPLAKPGKIKRKMND